MIADGRKSLEEAREEDAERHRRAYAARNSPGDHGEFPEDPEDTSEPIKPKAVTGKSKKDARKATNDARAEAEKERARARTPRPNR
ncbi:hypothetical protein [Acuticoccus kandeliae]|uniref:hypothetical protein n=1 Tax=Acuticoccus kandeliae TaxID=2073160 RepID=UPI00130046A5|nr:hypothetical protein [Acuticoccus kandeliae]